MKLREVMIVDDSDADLLYTRVVLEAAGVAEQVRCMGTGREALDHLTQPQGHRVDLILLDINMPEMSGFEFLEAYRRLQADQRTCAVVVMLTSSPSPDDRARALAFPCVRDYVIKPIDPTAARRLVGIVAAGEAREAGGAGPA